MPTPGNDAVGSYGPAGEYDPPDGYPLAEYDPLGTGDEVLTPLPLPREEPPHWQRAETADSLTADLLLPGRHALPPLGWRRVVYQATGGLVHPQQSAAERRPRGVKATAAAGQEPPRPVGAAARSRKSVWRRTS